MGDPRKHLEDDKRQFREDVRAVLGTAAGRRVLIAILNISRVYAPTGPRASALEMAYDNGYRDAAAELLAASNASAPELVLLATQERTQLQSQRRAESPRGDARKDDNE